MKPGDKVHWTEVRARGRTLSMERREGTLELLMGGVARVRLASGKQIEIRAVRLRLDDQPSQIDEFVGAMREASKERQTNDR